MTLAMKRVSAIIQKEWKDSSKNPVLLLTAVIPVIFAFLFRSEQSVGASVLTMPMNMALSITGAFVQAMMVAEEKEKHTLRVLMLSPAKPIEVLLGKSAISAIMTVSAVILSILIANTPSINLVSFLLLLIPNIVMYLALGTLIGLMSRTSMETSFLGMPLLLIFLMGPMFGALLNSEAVNIAIGYLPTEQMAAACDILWNGGSLTDIWSHIGVTFIWAVASVLLCIIVYRAKRYDA
ncbi:ABC transporter permease [Paenibacillus sp. MER TA 81-3]|uniref:ABC transporter permease n=1 Tax=Paenibacillus sp. MER TA 81-3 TaxID=2939573 RepID=UPI0020409726|nr:ABC transporter permease [Paenibacillus sp. MER TA 81-3]MCM3338573.1 ABC transporter permease [Paenibacillus sp. MER TA 81-3]